MPPKYLKRGNVPTLILYLIWNVAIFLVVCNGTTDFWDNTRQRVAQLKARDSLFCFLTPLVLTIACGLLPASWKATLVFWRIKNALPGSRAFTELAKRDPRIDASRLRTKLGKAPTTPRDENAVWYRWYKAVQDHVTVQEAHKQFLLNRDLTGISFLFLVFGTLAIGPSGASPVNVAVYLVITMLQYVVFSIVARNHGNRFVSNVLVEYQNK
jgi:hypothetical protein